jgi:hypothetical protein
MGGFLEGERGDWGIERVPLLGTQNVREARSHSIIRQTTFDARVFDARVTSIAIIGGY